MEHDNLLMRCSEGRYSGMFFSQVSVEELEQPCQPSEPSKGMSVCVIHNISLETIIINDAGQIPYKNGLDTNWQCLRASLGELSHP